MRRPIIIGSAVLALIPAMIVLHAITAVLWGFSGSFTTGEHAECAIVFGAAVYSRSVPGPAITRRTDAGARLYTANQVDRLIFTGGKGDDFQLSEADVMRNLAMERYAIPATAIAIESNSTSTWENIVNSKPLLDECDSLVAVSDRYHLARIQLIAKIHGVQPMETYAAEEGSSVRFEIQSVLREVAGYLYYEFRDLFPAATI